MDLLKPLNSLQLIYIARLRINHQGRSLCFFVFFLQYLLVSAVNAKRAA
jgi:hypothetical protein